MTITYELKGLSEIISKLKLKPSQALDQISKALNVGCGKMMSDIREMISIVGEPDGVPRRRTGDLLKSIKVGKQKREGNKITQSVGANPDSEEEGYSIYLEYGCFFSKHFKVLTKRGMVDWENVKIGDFVFTHTQSWKKVIDKIVYNLKSVIKEGHMRITTEKGDSIVVTLNHPILTPNGWTPAGNLRTGDTVLTVYNDLPRFHWKNFREISFLKGRRLTEYVKVNCKKCGKEIEKRKKYFDNHKSFYCSKECSYLDRKGERNSNFGKTGKHWNNTEEFKEKRRGQNNPMFKQDRRFYYSQIGFREDLGHKVKSSWEANYCRILKCQKINYFYEAKSFDIGDNRTYTPDIMLKDDYFVEIKGFMDKNSTYKIGKFKEIYPNIRLDIIGGEEYKNLEKEWSGKLKEWEFGTSSRIGNQLRIIPQTIMAVKSFINPRRKLYDLIVEDDHSYVANRILVHNTSRMKPRPYITVGVEKNMDHMINQLGTALKNIC